LIFLISIVGYMQDVIRAEDIDVGDVIVLAEADGPVVVSRVRLGHGGLILNVTPASGGAAELEQHLKLTAMVGLRERGRDREF
jgi:hypothetical protein